jgi:hypothetical protein
MPGALSRARRRAAAAGRRCAPPNPTRVADVPDAIVLKRDRDLDGRRWQIWIRRGAYVVLVALIVLALVNVFGQRPTTASAGAPQGSLKVYAPTHLRGGLLYMARFTISARRDIKKATLVLDPGWAESITINTIEPSPISEASANGKLSFLLGHIPAGGQYRLFMEFQVNPTNVGRRSQDAQLLDGDTPIVTVDRKVTVFP